MASSRRKQNNTPNNYHRSNPHPHTKSMSKSISSSPLFTSFKKHLLYIPLLIMIFAALFLLSISSNTLSAIGSDGVSPHNYVIEVVNEFPHDPKAFTQGLLYGGNDTVFDSTGLYGQSTVRQVAIQTGEGLTLIGDRLYQVTWLKKIGFIYDQNNFRTVKSFTHQMGDGWGLATDGKCLFGTDESSTLYQIDPLNMKVIKKQAVTYNGHEVHNLNELEYINDEVWANVWQTDCIARISPKDGVVREWILLQSLREGLQATGRKNFDVLNGIAWDKENNRIFVTGKLWPKLYEIKLHPAKKELHGNIEDICMPKRFVFGTSS
ncbi:hypothetical protein DCAR_0728278 [Daucus carota subsp. sativus]|uniref:Glutamine cyclotransferase n=1 Tax=Daucus carota subsp. sativus TaxID=79200 RepID=A0AAF1B8P4_DAUCS|nr:hypothetical protein DCAR_0728278 [Daucus carota subsp. sativus]